MSSADNRVSKRGKLRDESRFKGSVSVFDLVAGRYGPSLASGHSGYQFTGTHLKHRNRAVPESPDEYLIKSKERFRDEGIPIVDHPDLPDSDLLKALHYYAGAYCREKEYYNVFASMDETSLLALGVTIEEILKDRIGNMSVELEDFDEQEDSLGDNWRSIRSKQSSDNGSSEEDSSDYDSNEDNSRPATFYNPDVVISDHGTGLPSIDNPQNNALENSGADTDNESDDELPDEDRHDHERGSEKETEDDNVDEEQGDGNLGNEKEVSIEVNGNGGDDNFIRHSPRNSRALETEVEPLSSFIHTEGTGKFLAINNVSQNDSDSSDPYASDVEDDGSANDNTVAIDPLHVDVDMANMSAYLL